MIVTVTVTVAVAVGATAPSCTFIMEGDNFAVAGITPCLKEVKSGGRAKLAVGVAAGLGIRDVVMYVTSGGMPS